MMPPMKTYIARSLLVLQNDQQAADFMEAFYTAFLGDVDEAALPVNPENGSGRDITER